MNERVYLLARKADALAREIEPDLREVVRYQRIRDEKFAELIVRDIHEFVDARDTAQILSNGILIMYGLKT
jgi:predicted transcriptional regulator